MSASSTLKTLALFTMMSPILTNFFGCKPKDVTPKPIDPVVTIIDSVGITKKVDGALIISEANSSLDPNNTTSRITFPGDFTLGSSLKITRSNGGAIVTFDNGTDENLTTTIVGKDPATNSDNYRFDVKEGKLPLVTNITPGPGKKDFGVVKDAQGNTIIHTEGNRSWVEVIKAYKGNSTSILLNRSKPGFTPTAIFEGATKLQTGPTGELNRAFYGIY
jgi:hypothetical protein